jgi:hypothetical protein
MAILTQSALTPAEVTQLGFVSLQNFLKNKPIDQVAQERPLLKALMAKKKTWGGGKENIVEQIRKDYDNNFMWFGDNLVTPNLSQDVTYNTRDTVRQAFYPWNSAHDGFQFSEDYLLGNGILIGDSQSTSNSSAAGLVQLTNIFNEAMEVLRLGFEKILDQSLHLDGTHDVGGGTADPANSIINGLDFLVPLETNVGTVGGINRAVVGNEYWRSNFDVGNGLNVTGAGPVGYAGAALLAPMTDMWRACQKNGGAPNLLIAGTDFVKSYEIAAIGTGGMDRYAVQPGSMSAPWNFDPSREVRDMGTFTGLFFQGIPIMWDPTFDDLDGIAGASSSNARGFNLEPNELPWCNHSNWWLRCIRSRGLRPPGFFQGREKYDKSTKFKS